MSTSVQQVNQESGLSLRERAASAAQARSAEHYRQKLKEARDREEKIREEFVATMRKKLGVTIDPATIGFTEAGAHVVVEDEPDDLIFSFTPGRYVGGDWGYRDAQVRLMWHCDTCKQANYTTDIEDVADLHERIKDVDKWEAGVAECPACRYQREENAPAAETPKPKRKTPEQELTDGLIEVMRNAARDVVNEMVKEESLQF